MHILASNHHNHYRHLTTTTTTTTTSPRCCRYAQCQADATHFGGLSHTATHCYMLCPRGVFVLRVHGARFPTICFRDGSHTCLIEVFACV